MKIRSLFFKPTNAHVLMLSFLLGVTSALLFGLQQALGSAENSVRPALAVAVLLQSTVTDDQARTLLTEAKSRDPEVLSVLYVSKAEALQEASKDPALSKSLMLLKENPLPASLIIRYSDRAWMERSEPAEPLKSLPEVQEIRWDAQARTIFRSLHQWRAWLLRLACFAVAMLVVWVFFGVYRFLALRAPLKPLAVQIIVGLTGGVVAAILWAYALRGVGMDASAFRPTGFSFLPLITGAAVAIACFGLGVYDTN